jgi:hypothetical protein
MLRSWGLLGWGVFQYIHFTKRMLGINPLIPAVPK